MKDWTISWKGIRLRNRIGQPIYAVRWPAEPESLIAIRNMREGCQARLVTVGAVSALPAAMQIERNSIHGKGKQGTDRLLDW